MTTRKELMAQTETIRGKAIEEMDRIRNDVTLSDDGRRRQLAKVTLATRKQLSEIQAKANRANEGDLQSATRTLFGPPFTLRGEGGATVWASYRDAVARADTIPDKDEAARLYRLANDMGDDLTMRAIANTGVRRGWDDIVHTHGQVDPGWFEQLGKLESLQAESDLPPTAAFERRVMFDFRTPTELQGIDIDEAARDDTPRTVPVGGPIPPGANI